MASIEEVQQAIAEEAQEVADELQKLRDQIANGSAATPAQLDDLIARVRGIVTPSA